MANISLEEKLNSKTDRDYAAIRRESGQMVLIGKTEDNAKSMVLFAVTYAALGDMQPALDFDSSARSINFLERSSSLMLYQAMAWHSPVSAPEKVYIAAGNGMQTDVVRSYLKEPAKQGETASRTLSKALHGQMHKFITEGRSPWIAACISNGAAFGLVKEHNGIYRVKNIPVEPEPGLAPGLGVIVGSYSKACHGNIIKIPGEEITEAVENMYKTIVKRLEGSRLSVSVAGIELAVFPAVYSTPRHYELNQLET